MKKSIIIFTVMLFQFSLFAQSDFEAAVKQGSQYWDSIPDSVKYASGSGYKQYLRTKSWIESRYGEDGTLTQYINAITKVKNSKQSSNPWFYTGPYDIPGGTQSVHQSSKGWIWSCEVNPANHNEIYVGGHHGGVWKTTDGGSSWSPLCDDIPEIGGIISLVVDWGAGQNGDDIIYALSAFGEGGLWSYSTGVFKSIDSGTTWSNINSGDLSDVFPSSFLSNLARNITIHPNNPDILYLITYQDIYKTTNAGDSWTNIKSDDFTWWEPNYEFGWYDIEMAVNGQSETIFVSGHKVIKSTDGGNSWSDITNSVTGSNQCLRCEIAVNNSLYPDRAYFFFNNGNQQITRYDISSNTFNLLGDFGTYGVSGANRNKMEIEISPTRSLTNGSDTEPFLYISGFQVYDFNPYRTNNEKVKISTSSLSGGPLDGPGQWVHDDIRSMQVLGENGTDRIFIGNDGGFSFAYSNSYGNCGNYMCWSNLSGGQAGLHCSEFYGVSTINSEDEKLIGGLQDCGVFVYDSNSSNNWIHSSSGDGSKSVLINPDNPDICFVGDFFNGGGGRILRSTDGGNYFGSALWDGLYIYPNSPMEFKPDNPEIMYLGEDKPDYDLLRFNNASSIWDHDVITPNGVNKKITSIGVCESNPDVLYTSCAKGYLWTGTPPADFENCIWRTVNSNASPPTWVDVSKNLEGLSQGYITDIEVNNYDENEIYVSFSLATNQSKLYKGTWDNNTQTMSWIDFSNGLPSSFPFNEIKFDKTNQILYAATDIGIYYCNPNEDPVNWYLYNDNLPKKIINDIDINYKLRKIYAATFGRGMWENELICNNNGSEVFVENSTTWEEKYLNGDLTIQNNATLTINDILGISDNLSITINNGSTLILNGSIESNCDENGYWLGDVIVKNGGKLIFNNGSHIKLKDNGLIKIKEGGDLEYNGGTIDLYNEITLLEIEGDLHIASNATFTYSGDGYIKFSNPGGDATNNIFCGTGSSFVLQGSGQNDKIMEVQQSTVHFPGGIDKVELRDGKIEMGSNCRLQNDIDTGDEETILNNIKITSDNGNNNGHRGFGFWGQQYVTIEDCTFEYGEYGLNANNTYWGSALTVSGSDFIENQTGLYVYNKGVHLNDCYFHENTGTAVECEAMQYASDIVHTDIKDNQLGLNYQSSSSADLNVDYCEIQNNTMDGVVTTGNFDLNIHCTYINNNLTGIYTEEGTRVRINDNAVNDLSNNDTTINLNYGLLYANNGYNELQSNNDDYAIYGETSLLCGGPPPTLNAEHNRWESDQVATPSFGNNYELWVYNCYPATQVNVVDNNPDYTHCFHLIFSPLSGSESTTETTETHESDLPYVSFSENNSMPLDEAIDTLASQSAQLTGETGYQEMLNAYISVIQSCESHATAQVQYYQDMAWGDMHNVIDGYFHHVNRNTENAGFNQAVDQVMSLNETLMENPDVSRTGYYEYSLDNALLERLRENYNQSLTLLDDLKYDIPEMDREIAYIDRWQCYIDAEREAKLGNISPDEFAEAIDNCNAVYEADMDAINEQDTLPGDEDSPGDTSDDAPAPNLTIIPNPNAGNFTVEVYSEVPNSGLRITNTYGQPVRTISLTDDGLQSVQVSGLAQG
ncbi:MAG: hypothetical protein R6V32_05835, partial [Bacteroidales bacterium]